MAKPKTWVPTSAEQALLVDLVTARMPRAAIAKRMGVSELKLRRFQLITGAKIPTSSDGQGGRWELRTKHGRCKQWALKR
jgi:hypothetical protein